MVFPLAPVTILHTEDRTDFFHIIPWLKILRWLSVTLKINITFFFSARKDQYIWLLPATLNSCCTAFPFTPCAKVMLGFLILNMTRSCTAKGQYHRPTNHCPITVLDSLPRLTTNQKFIICPTFPSWTRYWRMRILPVLPTSWHTVSSQVVFSCE